MAKVHLIIGPVGAGKSTFASQLAIQHQAVQLTLDDWFTRLFSDDRPEHDVMAWYQERSDRCIDQIWCVAQDLLDRERDVVLELGLIRRDRRRAFCDSVRDAERALRVYQLEAPRELRRERVLQRNKEKGPTYSMSVPADVFELASDLWQPLDEDECHELDVRHIGHTTPTDHR